MNKLIKQLFGIDKIEAEKETAIQETAQAKEQARLAKLSPKELATELKEPWVDCEKINVDKGSVRNGFFELDWNDYFVLQLRTAGYQGDNDEDVVNQWFIELCRNVGTEEGVDMNKRGAGYVNRAIRDDGMTEVS